MTISQAYLAIMLSEKGFGRSNESNYVQLLLDPPGN